MNDTYAYGILNELAQIRQYLAAIAGELHTAHQDAPEPDEDKPGKVHSFE